MSDVWEVKANPYQEEFLACKKRFPAIIASIGTGKTMFGLMKVWAFCEKYPNSLFMIVRKEYTDLRDSTLRDCLHYFGATFNSDKEYTFKNGSVIMARHGAELAVLKNVNLSGFLIEFGSLAAARSNGKVRTEGKTYIMQPDDVVEFRFNV